MYPDSLLTARLLLKKEDFSRAKDVLSLYKNNRFFFEIFEPTRPANFYTLEYHIENMIRETSAQNLGLLLRYYIYELANPDKIIGSINFNFNNEKKQAVMGYKIDHLHQNKGFCFEACFNSIGLISKSATIKELIAKIHPNNKSSLAIVNKLNFNFLTIEKNSANILGKNQDLMIYRKSII